MGEFLLGEDAKKELLAVLVETERKKNVSEEAILEKLIFTYGLTRVEADELMTN